MTAFQPGRVVALPFGVRVAGRETAGDVGEPVLGAAPGATRGTRGGEPVDTAGVLDGALARTGFRTQLSLPFDELHAFAAVAPGTRADLQPAALDVTVPAPGAGEAQVVLEVDGAGVVRWHFARGAAAGAARRGGGTHETFSIPVDQYALPPGEPATAGRRGLLGFGRRKVLHLLRFPVEWVAGQAARSLAALWEQRNRPYGLREAGLPYFDAATRAALPPVGAEWFARRGGDDPVLLLVHGTFSTGYSGFAGLGTDPGTRARLEKRYGDGILALDHPTLHHDPALNAHWLLRQLPADRPCRLHVLSHSRGGLVARLLTDPRLAAAAGRPVPVVEKLIHVATPNAGTVLARSDRLHDLLDIVTNVAALFLDDVTGTVTDPVLEIVKDVASGAHGGLPGLAAMDPDNPWLHALNSGPRPGGEVYAITTDFRPGDGAALALRVLDGLADALFGAANDLVVPTEGVYRAGRYTVDDPLTVTGGPPAVAHTGFFGSPAVRDAICGRLGA